MNVLQLLTTVNVKTTVNEINTLDKNESITEKQYTEDFLKKIKLKILQTTPYQIEISRLRITHDDPVDNAEKIDVSIVVEDTYFSLSFTSWSIILGCELICAAEADLSREEQAAHLYLGMIGHGGEEESVNLRDELTDMVEGIEKKKVPLRKLVKNPSQDVFDALFPDYTEEQKEELRKDSIRRIENRNTRKFYKNDIKQLFDFFDSKPVFME